MRPGDACYEALQELNGKIEGILLAFAVILIAIGLWVVTVQFVRGIIQSFFRPKF